MRKPSGGGAGLAVPGFLLPFGHRHSLLGSSCARWGITPSSRSAYREHLRRPGPHRGCRVAHEQDPTGQGAPLTPGTVVRSRPATILRPAPAAFQRPVPTAPLTHPIDGGHLHEASSGVHLRSPITPGQPAAAPGPGSLTIFPPVFSSPAAPGWNKDRFGFYPRLRTPRSPTTHAEAETGQSRTGPSTTPPASTEPPNRCLPLHSCTITSHIVAGGLHHDQLDPFAAQPVRQLQQRA